MSKTNYLIQHLIKIRKAKKLTQQALADKAALTQAHISNIERGKVDSKISTLIDLTRALEAEVMLVPRQWVNTVEAFITQGHSDGAPLEAYRLEEEEDEH